MLFTGRRGNEENGGNRARYFRNGKGFWDYWPQVPLFEPKRVYAFSPSLDNNFSVFSPNEHGF